MGSFSVKNIAAMAIWRLTHFSGMTIWHLWMNDERQTEGIHSIWGSGRENNGSSEKGDNLLAVYDV
ncbi:hypothetical protein IC575_027832 [Cucumis melo]